MATLHFTSATLYDYLDLGKKANVEITQRYDCSLPCLAVHKINNDSEQINQLVCFCLCSKEETK